MEYIISEEEILKVIYFLINCDISSLS